MEIEGITNLAGKVVQFDEGESEVTTGQQRVLGRIAFKT
jgi:hypothetical protein